MGGDFVAQVSGVLVRARSDMRQEHPPDPLRSRAGVGKGPRDGTEKMSLFAPSNNHRNAISVKTTSTTRSGAEITCTRYGFESGSGVRSVHR